MRYAFPVIAYHQGGNMRIGNWALVAAAMALLPPAAAAEEGSGDKALKSILSKMPAEFAECLPHDREQEEADATLTTTAWDLLTTGDVAKLRAMLPELEAAGNHAPDRPSLPERCEGKVYVYTDDIMTLLLTAGAVNAKDENGKPISEGKDIDVVQMAPLPYARLHFIIGWLYFDKGEYGMADTWFARGLKNDPRDAMLASEHANTLSKLGRSAEALAFTDAFLAENGEDLPDRQRALMLRRRGFALGDLRRHQEAIATYKEALKYEPGNAVAKEEMKWNKQQLKARK